MSSPIRQTYPRSAPDYRPRRGTPVGFGIAALYIETLDRRIARGVIRDRHYSRTVVNNSTLHLGVFQRHELVGILQYGYALNPRSMDKIVAGTAIDEYLELNRMWLSDRAPRNSESRAIAYSIRLIRRLRPQIAWIQAFADGRCGVGTVYQAAGFAFLGAHTATFWHLDGNWFHNIIATATTRGGGQRGAHLRANIHRATRHRIPQYRYIRFLARRARRNLRMPTQPYPKHPTQPVDATMANNPRSTRRVANLLISSGGGGNG